MQYGSRFLVCLEKSMQNGVCSAYCIGKGGRDTRDCNMNAHRIHIAADYRKANQAEYKRKKRKPLKTQRFTLSCITESMGFEPTHRSPGLTHFECAPLNRLGNSPVLAYYRAWVVFWQSQISLLYAPVLLYNYSTFLCTVDPPQARSATGGCKDKPDHG